MEQQHVKEIGIYPEDEIDLRAIFKTIVKYKTMLFSITAFITICAVIYAFSKTPVYEARATVEIGNISSSGESFQHAMLEESVLMQKRFQSIYMNQSYVKQYPKISKIAGVKGTKNLVEITSESTDTQSAVEKLNELVSNIINEHGKKFNHYLFSMENKIALLKEHKNELIKQKQNLENQIVLQQGDIDAIIKKNAAVAAVYSMELSRKSQSVIEIKDRIFELSDRLNGLESAILPENIKNTHLIGEVVKNNLPVQPKKKLSITLGFVVGLFLSLFLVFFVEYVRNNKHELR